MQQIKIRVKGHIDKDWSEWFDGLTISHSGLNETALTGYIADQAALYGLLSKLRNLGVSLISLSAQNIEEDSNNGRIPGGM